MNFLNQSDFSNRPLFKYIIIGLVLVNAIVLALLLFLPGRLSAASASNSSENTVDVSEDTGEGDTSEEEEESEESSEADTDEEASEEDSDEEGEMPESGPLLELVDDHVTLKVGDYFNFYDYIKTMRDRDGSELSRYIHLVGNVDTYTPGDYTITYQITSQIDGETASKDLVVTVEN